MSRSKNVLRLAILIGSIGTVAACADTPTSPISRNARFAAIEGDTTECGSRGWSVVNGRYVCNPE